MITISSKCQTKEETKEWLTYHLNKLIIMYPINPVHTWESPKDREQHQIGFDNDTLVHYYTYALKSKNHYKDSTTDSRQFYIDMSKVKKVTLTTITFGYTHYLNIRFDFTEQNFTQKKYAVREYYMDYPDYNHKRDITKGHTYSYDLRLLVDAMDNDPIIGRLQKAIEHLCRLNGAPLLKEVF